MLRTYEEIRHFVSSERKNPIFFGRDFAASSFMVLPSILLTKNIKAIDSSKLDKEVYKSVYKDIALIFGAHINLDVKKFNVLSISFMDKSCYKMCDCANDTCSNVKLADRKFYTINKLLSSSELDGLQHLTKTQAMQKH